MDDVLEKEINITSKVGLINEKECSKLIKHTLSFS